MSGFSYYLRQLPPAAVALIVPGMARHIRLKVVELPGSVDGFVHFLYKMQTVCHPIFLSSTAAVVLSKVVLLRTAEFTSTHKLAKIGLKAGWSGMIAVSIVAAIILYRGLFTDQSKYFYIMQHGAWLDNLHPQEWMLHSLPWF